MAHIHDLVTRFFRPLPRLVCVLLVGLSLGGCALQNALQTGHDHVGRAEYRAALAAYDRALRIDPDSDEARRLKAQLTPYAVTEASDEAHGEMAQGHYEQAHKLAFYVLDLDREAGDTLHAQNAALMHAGAEGLFNKGLVEPSYALSARMQKLYPRHHAVLSLLERARRHFFALSEKRAGDGDFDGALAAVQVVEHYEPALAPEVDQRRADLKGRWADRLASGAEQYDANNRRGAAAVMYARAYAIGHKPAHLEAMRARTQELRKEGRFVLGIQPDDSAQARQLSDLISDRSRSVEGLTLPTSGDDGVSLIATVSGTRASCRQDTSIEQGAQDYVSGYREVPNPAFDSLTREVSQLQSRLDHSDRAVIEARKQAHARRREAARCEAEQVRPAQDKLHQAAAAAAAAQAKVADLREQEKRLEERLARLPAGPRSNDERARIERRLEELRKRLNAARKHAKQLAHHEQQAQQVRNAAASVCAGKLADAEQALKRSEQLGAERNSDAERLAHAQAELAATPSHNTVEVIDTFHFPVQYVQRSCGVVGALNLQPAWTSPESRQLQGVGKTDDRAHSGYPRYGVIANPLGFARSDAELINLAAGAAADDAVVAIRERARAYYAYMTAKALDLAHTDAHAATDLMLAMLLAAPGQLSEEHKTALAQHLDKHYQLQDWHALAE